MVCGKCDAWYYCYGVVTAYCTCGNRFSRQALKAATNAGAVIAGAGKPTFKEVAAGAPWNGDKQDGTTDALGQPGAGSVPESAD